MNMRIIFYTFLLFHFVCIIKLSPSQNSNFYPKHYTADNDLFYNQIRCINQQNGGVLWIDTWEELSRFDGY